LLAGADAVIASLWSVNDESTPKLFAAMYRSALGLDNDSDLPLEQADLAEALATAQREIKKKYPDPHYWAAFVLIGG
jgi:CHAT domain-containing protein